MSEAIDPATVNHPKWLVYDRCVCAICTHVTTVVIQSNAVAPPWECPNCGRRDLHPESEGRP